MNGANLAGDLQEEGVALLRGALDTQLLARLKSAAERCFDAVESEGAIADRYGFNRFSHSVPISALLDFGCTKADLSAPMAVSEVTIPISKIIKGDWECRIEHSWVRKKFAPNHWPSRDFRLQGWHQDGALGVSFSAEPGPVPPMIEVLTFWIPLNACGVDSPGLEFVCGQQPALIHFTELDDAAMRQRFGAEAFCAPELAPGDGLIFLNSVLHRTFVRPAMTKNRLSVEYRVFGR